MRFSTGLTAVTSLLMDRAYMRAGMDPTRLENAGKCCHLTNASTTLNMNRTFNNPFNLKYYLL